MSAARPGRRLLLVHAHPDDESIGNGATMARYAAEGVGITLVTCTRGEQGEVIPPGLAHLAADVAGDGSLGDHRVKELGAAVAALGVSDYRFLGDPVSPGRSSAAVLADGAAVYLDSGMAYAPDGTVVAAPVQPAGSFAVTDPDVPATWLAQLVRDLQPQVVIGYEPGGGYGHPDHVQAHRVTMRAADLAASGADGWRVPKVYWTVQPESLARAAASMMAAAAGEDYRGLDPAGPRPSEVVPDELVTTVVDATGYTAAKVAALRAHATQVAVSDDDAFFALSNHVPRPVVGLEFYRLVRGSATGPYDDVGRETDLFAGL